MFSERRREQKVNGAGKVTAESVKVFEVYPGLPGEDAYRRLVEENGRPVPPEALANADRERQKHVEDYARAQTQPSERQKEAREVRAVMKEREERREREQQHP